MSIRAPLDVCVPGVCLRCTIDTRHKSSEVINSSAFRFQGDEWRLHYYSVGLQHILGLNKNSSVHDGPFPFHVSVRVVEGAGTERIGTDLTEERLFNNDVFNPKPGLTNSYSPLIWRKTEDEIKRTVPEFPRNPVLQLLVVMKVEDCDPTFSQIECSVPEATEQSSRTSWTTSVLSTLLPSVTTFCLESLSEDLAQLMIEGPTHDVEFNCAGQSVKAHKLIVSKRSPVIATMLASDMVEGRTGVVNIPNMEPDVFRHFLRYIYSGQLPELIVDLALSLYESGDQYAVLGLAKRCSEYLVEHLSTENACRVLVVADAHNSEDFRQSVKGFMLDNEVPVSGEDWQDFCDAHPKLANEVLNGFCLKLKHMHI